MLELLRAAGVPQAGFPVLPTVAHERLSKNVMGTQGTHVVTYYTHMHTDLHTHRWTRVHTLTQMDTPSTVTISVPRKAEWSVAALKTSLYLVQCQAEDRQELRKHEAAKGATLLVSRGCVSQARSLAQGISSGSLRQICKRVGWHPSQGRGLSWDE